MFKTQDCILFLFRFVTHCIKFLLNVSTNAIVIHEYVFKILSIIDNWKLSFIFIMTKSFVVIFCYNFPNTVCNNNIM